MKQIFFFFLFVSIANFSIAQNPDIDILKKINLNRNKNFDPAFKTIGNITAPVAIGISLGVLSSGFIKHDSTLKNKGVVIAASLLLTAGITTGVKYAVNRPRPFVTYPFIEKATHANTPSFPSGHTSDGFATATSLSLAFPKWYVVTPSFLWACSVAYSRMDLGVHYPSDVLTGAIIGAGTSFLCYKANHWLHKRHPKN